MTASLEEEILRQLSELRHTASENSISLGRVEANSSSMQRELESFKNQINNAHTPLSCPWGQDVKWMRDKFSRWGGIAVMVWLMATTLLSVGSALAVKLLGGGGK